MSDLFKNIVNIKDNHQHGKAANQPNLLMIAYWFPPLKTVSLRSYFAYREFKKYFSTVQVITTDNNKKLPLEELPMPPEDLHSVFTLDYRTVLQGNGKNQQSHFEVRKKESKWMQIFIKLIDSFPFNLLIGEGNFFYTIAGFLKARQLIQQHHITHIYSTFRPYSDHAIAYLLKVFYPKLVWIADFRDLHIDHNHNDLFWVPFQKWCNHKIISKADLVTTVSNGLAEPLQKYSPPVYVLRNGYQQLYPITENQASDFFQISYTGSIYTSEQSPKILLKVIANLIQNKTIDKEKIKLVYAGKDGGIWEEWMKEHGLLNIFENKALIPRIECVKLQQKSHLNFLLSFTKKGVRGIIGGKIYEYLAAKNPILCIICGDKDDEFEVLFKDLNAGKIIYPNANQEDELQSFIADLYQEWLENGRVHQPINMKKLAEYQLENTIPQLLNYMEEIRSNK